MCLTKPAAERGFRLKGLVASTVCKASLQLRWQKPNTVGGGSKRAILWLLLFMARNQELLPNLFVEKEEICIYNNIILAEPVVKGNIRNRFQMFSSITCRQLTKCSEVYIMNIRWLEVISRANAPNSYMHNILDQVPSPCFIVVQLNLVRFRYCR